MIRLCYLFGRYVLGPIVEYWSRGIELSAEARDVLAGRGEVADAPDPADVQPVWQACRLNASPHWCFNEPTELTNAQVDAAFAEIVKQFPKTKDRRIR